MPFLHSRGARSTAARVDWADVAKGLSIILVVVMHSTLGVGNDLQATGWAHTIVGFAKPFRMPDFFLVAGLFAGAALNASWRSFVDRRVLHFGYFYLLWVILTLGLKSAVDGVAPVQLVGHLIQSLYEPYSSLWFIYVLPFMFLAVRLTHRLPAALVIAAAGALHIAASFSLDGGVYALSSDWSGWYVIDALALFLVFFLIGHHARTPIMALAAWAQRQPLLAGLVLAGWALFNLAIVLTGAAAVPGLVLVGGLAGALAVVVLSALLALVPALGFIAAIGRKSLVIYLAFSIPMAATRLLLVKSGLISDVGLISALTALSALVAPLVLAAMVRGTRLAFLFERPGWARLGNARG